MRTYECLCETFYAKLSVQMYVYVENLRDITVTVIRTVARYALNGDSVLLALSLGYLHKMTPASNA